MDASGIDIIVEETEQDCVSVESEESKKEMMDQDRKHKQVLTQFAWNIRYSQVVY